MSGLLSILGTVFLPLIKLYSLGFLKEENVIDKQRRLLKKKFKLQEKTGIGKKLGITEGISIDRLPATNYSFYAQLYNDLKENDLMYPIDDYIKVFTSGTMGQPKTFLIPRTAVMDNLGKSGLSFLLISTHDGTRITFKPGDTMYRNVPGRQYVTGFLSESLEKSNSWWINQVPDLNLTFKEKVDYFVENYSEIDIASMTVTTLLDDVKPRIDESFKLKGFVTQDRSAIAYQDEIYQLTGTYPKVAYGSTETLFCGIPSIEYPGCFFFDWRVVYTEFLPENELLNLDEPIQFTDKIIDPTRVKIGSRYQLIVTPLKIDITRYLMPDILECVSIGDSVLGTSVPVFRYYSRMDKLLVLHNFTRVSENELLSAFKESGLSWVDFTARIELIGAREHIFLYLETDEAISEDEFALNIHQVLLRMDKDWAAISESMSYVPLKIVYLPQGAFKRYLGNKIGMPRIERVNMKQEWLDQLVSE